MNKINSLTKIKSLYPDITSSEKSIADFILDNPEEIYRLTIKDLARKTNVSLPTVFRFAKRLGFNGFKDFKVELIKDISVGFHISPEGIEDGNKEAIARNLFEKEILNLKETLSNINFSEIQEAVNAISNSNRMLLFAISSSLPVALDFYLKFTTAGFNCFHNPDIYTQTVISTQSKKNDVAIGISFSGESKEVVHCLENAKNNGTKTICITTFINSSITKYSDIKLFTAPVQSLYQRIDLPSRMAQIALLNVLYLLVVIENKDRATKFISKSETELLHHIRK
jgi:DNA-binding MurR/RpiR family transcriptional regulator